MSIRKASRSLLRKMGHDPIHARVQGARQQAPTTGLVVSVDTVTKTAVVTVGGVNVTVLEQAGFLPAVGQVVPVSWNGAEPIVMAPNVMVDGGIQSKDFVTGVSGWRIDALGDAEFNDIDARGVITSSGVNGTAQVDVGAFLLGAFAQPVVWRISGTTGNHLYIGRGDAIGPRITLDYSPFTMTLRATGGLFVDDATGLVNWTGVADDLTATSTTTGLPAGSTFGVYATRRGKLATVRTQSNPNGDFTANHTIVLPVGWESCNAGNHVGAMSYTDASAAPNDKGSGSVEILAGQRTLSFIPARAGVGAVVGTGSPIVWAAGDSMSSAITYELA